MRGDQRRVDIDCQPLRRAVQRPEPLARPRVRSPQHVHQPGVGRDPIDHPERRRVRRDGTEQRLLIAHRPEIGHALAAVGQHHRQVPNHPARVMPTTSLLQARQPQRQRPGQSNLVSDLRYQRAARVRHQTRSIRRDLYGYPASSTHHPQGEPPSSGSGPSTSPRIPAQPDRTEPPGAVLIARSGLGADPSDNDRSRGQCASRRPGRPWNRLLPPSQAYDHLDRPPEMTATDES